MEGPACADTGARTPIGASGIYKIPVHTTMFCLIVNIKLLKVQLLFLLMFHELSIYWSSFPTSVVALSGVLAGCGGLVGWGNNATIGQHVTGLCGLGQTSA